jgi:hypothetical protein
MSRKVWVYLLLSAIAIACVSLWCYASHLSVAETSLPQSYDVQTKVVDLYMDSIKSLSSYALLVIAGVGYFVQLIVSKNSGVTVGTVGKYFLIAAVFACAVSLLFGYLGYMNVIEMFYGRLELNPADPRVHTFHQIQFWAFMVSVVLFGIFSCEALLD